LLIFLKTLPFAPYHSPKKFTGFLKTGHCMKKKHTTRLCLTKATLHNLSVKKMSSVKGGRTQASRCSPDDETCLGTCFGSCPGDDTCYC
jgi:hypothetical protein